MTQQTKKPPLAGVIVTTIIAAALVAMSVVAEMMLHNWLPQPVTNLPTISVEKPVDK
jgi:hypothetical protein